MTVFMRPVDVRAYCSLCEKREMCDSLSFSIYKEKPAEKIQRASMLLELFTQDSVPVWHLFFCGFGFCVCIRVGVFGILYGSIDFLVVMRRTG